jgi:hypothetical protein
MRARCLAIAAGFTLFTACGSSPLAPTNNGIELVGFVIWTDPDHGELVVSYTDVWTLVTVTPGTRFSGDVSTAAALFSAFQTGSRLDVTVIGSPTGASTFSRPDLVASSVTSVRSAATLFPNAVWSEQWQVLGYEPRLTAVVMWHYILVVRPWTVFDPTGDISTYEDFLAAASSGELKATSATGDAWSYGFYMHQARSLKVIRTGKKSSATSGVPADARGWTIDLRRPFQ